MEAMFQKRRLRTLELLERPGIFDRFYRLRRSINTPGTGLGLSLVAAVAELHGIKLTVATNGPGVQMIMTLVPNTHTQ